MIVHDHLPELVRCKYVTQLSQYNPNIDILLECIEIL